jgi:single-strand DNA-binding protein
MPSLNKVAIMGNLTRDPELRFTPKGAPVCDIGLAINRRYKTDDGVQKEEVTFVDITFWSKAAETIAQYCKKGEPLYVEGRLQMDTWEDKTSGDKRSKLKIVGESFQFLGGKDKEKGPEAQQEPAASQGAAPEQPTQMWKQRQQEKDKAAAQAEVAGAATGEDDIPF